MNTYKFDTLNDEEFEELSKDLMREELGLDFRTYRKGRDGGIDLSCINNDHKMIAGQVKHYPKSNYSNLKSSLKKELEKVKNKNFERYLLITSLDLSAGQVTEIMKLMNGVIKSEEDIYDLKKLNTILQQKGNEWIEKKYYKLWLSSTTVLDRIIHNAQENNIEYYIDGIEEKLRLYVITENFDKALEILNKTNMLLINGEPGVGKTVLAEMLVYKYLDKGYKLKFITGDSIKELEQIMSIDKDEKEIVFIDDFLGANFLELFTSTSENKMVSFLNKYLRKKNKLVILTTRSTIYNKGIQQFEKLGRFSVEFEEYNLKVSSYNDIDKAKIFYNHLYFNEIGKEFIEVIKKDEIYLQIIRHRNYTPRLIEFILNKNRISQIETSEYLNFIFHNLDNPKEIWKNEFENKISAEDRFLVWTIFTLDRDIDENIVKNAFEERYDYEIRNNNFVATQDAFCKALKTLSQGFVRVNRYNDKGKSTIVFINPSINDFLINYLNDDRRERKRILSSVKYLEQLEKFSSNKTVRFKGYVNIDDYDKTIIKQKVIGAIENINVYRVDKEIAILKIIITEYKNDNSMSLIIKGILDEFVKNNRMNDEELEIVLELIINGNIGLLEVETIYEKNGMKEKVQYILLDKITYIKTFRKYLIVNKLNLSYEDNSLLLNEILDSNKVYRLCIQALADFANDLSIYYECGAEEDEGGFYFDWDEAASLVENKFESFKYDIIMDEDLLDFREVIEENLEEIYVSDYGVNSGYRLLEAIEDIWNEDYKDSYGESFTHTHTDTDKFRIFNMFKCL